MRHSECEMVSTGSFFSAQGDRKGPAPVYKLNHTRSVLFLNVIIIITVLRVRLRYVNTSLP